MSDYERLIIALSNLVKHLPHDIETEMHIQCQPVAEVNSI